jgi:glutathionyl-hydroquinone reductase
MVQPAYASPVDYGRYGQGRGFDNGQSFQRPVYQFQGRIIADGSSGFRAEPGRYRARRPASSTARRGGSA